MQLAYLPQAAKPLTVETVGVQDTDKLNVPEKNHY